MNAADLLDVLIARAPALRAAGVIRVTLDEMCVELLPPEPKDMTTRRVDDTEQIDEPDPLFDATTYGRRSGLPGFTRPEDDEK